MADCSWKPLLPFGHTDYSWNGTNTPLPPPRSPSLETTNTRVFKRCKKSSKSLDHLRSSHTPSKTNQKMKLITNNMFICQFCHQTLQKRSVCFTPSCYYWSRPCMTEQSTTSSKHNTICHTNVKYNNCNNDLMNDDRSNWNRFKGILSYDGYAFYGWQSQLNVETIQDLLEWRLSQYFKCKITVVGCSRTDAKVHANNQTFHCDLPIYKHKHLSQMDERQVALFIQKILNSLPKYVFVKSIEAVDKQFHSRFSCFGKRYIYSIIQKERCNPSERMYHYNINENNRTPLNIEKMVVASRILIGKHDFTALAVQNDKNKIEMPSYKGETPSPIKYMKQIKIVTSNKERNISIHMVSSGFLYKMARSIAGTLIEIGLGKLSIQHFQNIFKSKKRGKEIVTAPGHGLAIDKVFYDKSVWVQIDNQH